VKIIRTDTIGQINKQDEKNINAVGKLVEICLTMDVKLSLQGHSLKN
jgi:hypothetical protein